MTSRSLETIAYTSIREKIISCEYFPGTILSENELANELNMSRTPIRSALSHLASEGFIVSVHKRGIQIRDLTYKEILDMYEAMLSMLLYVLDFAERYGSAFDAPMLRELLNRQLEASKVNDYRSYIEHSLLFRRAVISAARNETMLQMTDSLRDKMIMKSVAHWKQTPQQQHYSANEINEAAYQAIVSGNLAEAKRVFVDAFHHLRGRVMLE
ncbi:GntR family transcriptional regulator [Paenibacillus hamazuiensis]|uniref:GntR family transcriptional regulator n=1 Tax=Paenibacillus hamazuiensis TaxID=2936508 RepID=UPI00200EB69A|nr:GntR family transcriptional regulator [Paenibacillus hamazuiensis]